jgi:hypothetical protein
MERRASALLGTPVRIDAVELSLHDGRGVVRGVHVANPPGFSPGDAVQLASMSVEVDLLTAFSSPTIVRAIRLDGAQVLYELDAQGNANLDVIRRAIDQSRRAARQAALPAAVPPTAATPSAAAPTAAASSAAAPGAAADAAAASPVSDIASPPAPSPTAARPAAAPATRPPAADKGGRRYIVSLLSLHDGTVRLDARAAGGPQRSESLPGFELTGIGADRPEGATPRQILHAVATAIARDVAVSAAATQLEKWLGKDVGGAVGQLLKKGGAGAIGHGLDGMLEKLFKR